MGSQAHKLRGGKGFAGSQNVTDTQNPKITKIRKNPKTEPPIKLIRTNQEVIIAIVQSPQKKMAIKNPKRRRLNNQNGDQITKMAIKTLTDNQNY